MPVHILHVVDSLGTGGLENGLVNLINQLDRYEHTVLAVRQLGANAGRLPAERVRVLSLDKGDAGNRFQALALARQIRAIQPNIVHSRNWGAIEAVLATRWVGNCFAVHSEHGLDTAMLEREPIRRLCMRRIAFELAHEVIMVSDGLRALHSKRTGFSACKIKVIHNGVDERRFRPDAEMRARVRWEWDVAEGEFVIGCVGRLAPVKDHLTLLKALQLLAGHFGNWRLVIFGEGPERQALQQFVNDDAQLARRVHLPGNSSRLEEFLNGFDVYVLPSISEGISNSLLEAMATGLPVIATRAGGNPEVIVDQDSGILFPVGDWRQLAMQLRLLEEDRDRLMSLGAMARRRIENEFSSRSMVQKYEELYSSMAAPAWATAAEASKG